jgi:hypothetical protein
MSASAISSLSEWPARTEMSFPSMRIVILLSFAKFMLESLSAQVAELADALASGASGLTVVEV